MRAFFGSDGFWKMVLQNWWGYNFNLILKIDSKVWRAVLVWNFLAPELSFVLYLYMAVLFRFMSSCCCFDEPLFALNALSEDQNTDKLIILANYCYEVRLRAWIACDCWISYCSGFYSSRQREAFDFRTLECHLVWPNHKNTMCILKAFFLCVSSKLQVSIKISQE